MLSLGKFVLPASNRGCDSGQATPATEYLFAALLLSTQGGKVSVLLKIRTHHPTHQMRPASKIEAQNLLAPYRGFSRRAALRRCARRSNLTSPRGSGPDRVLDSCRGRALGDFSRALPPAVHPRRCDLAVCPRVSEAAPLSRAVRNLAHGARSGAGPSGALPSLGARRAARLASSRCGARRLRPFVRL